MTFQNAYRQQVFLLIRTIPFVAQEKSVALKGSTGPGYRLYLAQDGDELIILFVGGTKKRQQADINETTALLSEYRGRKATAKKPRK